MSFEKQALRDLVLQRLAAAADDIFSLFESTFTKYEEELLQSRLQQEPKEVLQNEDVRSSSPGCLDVQGLSTQTEVNLGLGQIKYEEKEVPLEVQFPPLKPEENVIKGNFLHQEPSTDNKQDRTREQFDLEKPGCSSDFNIKEFETCSDSDTDNSEDWEPATKKKTKSNGQTNSTYHMNLGKASGSCDYQQEIIEESVSFQREPMYTYSLCTALNDAKDKPFSCPVCCKSFPQKRNLKAHMRIHTGEKPYHCKPCGLSFRFQQNYFQHDLAVHRKEKPFRCRICKKDFVHKIEMIAHRNSHNSKSASCSKCNKVFNCVRYLKRHMERCNQKKKRQNESNPEGRDSQMSFPSQSTAPQGSPGFDSLNMFSPNVNDWL